MYIEKIMIKSFGGLREREFMLSPGVNIFEGENESGKTTVAAAIKFVLYGLPQKVTDGTTLTERRKYLSWDGSPASVSLVLSAGGRRILAERHLSVSTDASGKES
ncbi:MAG TPA: AAA family ATPase, partial [Bacillota bacterium]|nr:AAA family ATPase [Bacillota bacterium]